MHNLYTHLLLPKHSSSDPIPYTRNSFKINFVLNFYMKPLHRSFPLFQLTPISQYAIYSLFGQSKISASWPKQTTCIIFRSIFWLWPILFFITCLDENFFTTSPLSPMIISEIYDVFWVVRTIWCSMLLLFWVVYHSFYYKSQPNLISI